MAWITDVFEGINLPPEAAEKLSEIESQVADLDAERVQLKIENENLKAENQKLRDEIAELYKTRTLVQGDTLDEIQIEILKAIATFHPCHFIHIEGQLVQMLSNQGKRPLIRAAIDHQLLRLTHGKYITWSSLRGTTVYKLKLRGSQYLEDNDLWPKL